MRATTHRKYKEANFKTERIRSNPVQYMIRAMINNTGVGITHVGIVVRADENI